MTGPTVLSEAGVYSQFPDVVWTGAEWGVVWARRISSSSNRIYFARFSPTGVSLGVPIYFPNVTATGGSAFAYDLVLRHTATLGYVLLAVGGPGSRAVLRVLGATATTLEPPIDIATTCSPACCPVPPFSADLAVAPDGEMGVLVSCTNSSFQRVNADGSVTAPPVTFSVAARDIDLVHDGVTWAATWTETVSSLDRITLARGPMLASRTTVVSSGLGIHPTLATGDGELLMLWRARGTTSETVYRIDGRRFSIHPSPTNPPSALDSAPRAYVSTQTVFAQRFAAVRSGDAVFLGWPDTRWGATEVYVRPVTLPPCAR